MKSPFERAAPRFIAKGIPVFPLVPNDKRPATKHGLNDASKDPAQIAEWIKKHPGANIGIPTGAASGLVVVDLDVKEHLDGRDNIKELKGYEQFDPTIYVTTPRGGVHIYFRNPSVRVKSRQDNPCKAVDIRGDGGYVVVPPSIIGGRSYNYGRTRTGVVPADLPVWLLELLKDKPFVHHPKKDYAPISGGDEYEKLVHALGFIASDAYETWVRVGMALHSYDCGCVGFSLFDTWSSGASNYDPKAVKRKWGHFGGGAGLVTISTIFYMAKEKGWRIKPEHRSHDFRPSR